MKRPGHVRLWQHHFLRPGPLEGTLRVHCAGHLLLYKADMCMAAQDPEAFLPERFLPGTPEAAAAPEHGWVPFGEGTRACIGLRCERSA